MLHVMYLALPKRKENVAGTLTIKTLQLVFYSSIEPTKKSKENDLLWFIETLLRAADLLKTISIFIDTYESWGNVIIVPRANGWIQKYTVCCAILTNAQV